MKHSRSTWALGLALTALAPAARAQASRTSPGRGVRLEVTPAGAFLRPDSSVVAPTPGGSGSLLPPSGLIWTHMDGGLAWIGGPVSLGNYGSEVFTEYTLNNEADALFSSFDTNPPTALWTDGSALGSEDNHVASAEATGTKISLHRFGSNPAPAVLSKYTNLSGTADWTYTFGFPTNGGTNCGISRDGQTIVAAASDTSAQTVEVAVFGPASGTPLSYTPVPVGANSSMRGFDLSADGSTLYFSAGVSLYIFDIATQAVVFTSNIGASFDSHAISGDGSVFAFGNFGVMRVWERVGLTYVNTFNRFVPGQNFCAYIDVSDDSQTIAYGFTFYNTYLTVQVEAIDVPSQAVTMTDVVTGTGSYQNVMSGVSISADGQRFAVGLWGDQGGLAAEMRLYARNQNAPVGTVDLPGSVFGISISADGQRMAAGSKAVHANAFGNGGRIDLFGDATPFTNYCFGDGSLVTPCPCGNTGLIGHGCQNSSTTGGSLLTAAGTTSPDTVVLTASAELATATSIFLQGNASNANGIVFGDGVRCADGTLKRIGVKTAVSGTVVYPETGDLSITARSAALGDPISPGSTRYYQTHYRDPVLPFCPNPPGNTWNVSNGIAILW